jgi:hypothetical protein
LLADVSVLLSAGGCLGCQLASAAEVATAELLLLLLAPLKLPAYCCCLAPVRQVGQRHWTALQL